MPPNPESDPPGNNNPNSQASTNPVVSPSQEGPNTNGHKNSNSWKDHWNKIDANLKTVLLIAGIVSVCFGLRAWVENAITDAVESKLSKPEILKKIAQQSRPSLIFNAAGAVVYDMGAVEWIEPNGLKITALSEYSSNAVGEVHIDFKRHLASPPLVTPIGDFGMATASRGTWLSWDFKVDLGAVQPSSKEQHLYRLEIIP